MNITVISRDQQGRPIEYETSDGRKLTVRGRDRQGRAVGFEIGGVSLADKIEQNVRQAVGQDLEAVAGVVSDVVRRTDAVGQAVGAVTDAVSNIIQRTDALAGQTDALTEKMATDRLIVMTPAERPAGLTDDDETHERWKQRIRHEERDAHTARRKQRETDLDKPRQAIIAQANARRSAIEAVGARHKWELLQLFQAQGTESNSLFAQHWQDLKDHVGTFEQRQGESEALHALHQQDREALTQRHAAEWAGMRQ